LIENLLDSGKSLTIGISLHFKPADLEALPKELVLDFQPNAQAKGAKQQALFYPFRRARSAEEKAVPGTGLGLYVTKLLAEKHGGEILLRSAPDKGTTVIMRLPLKRARLIIF